MPSKKEWKEIKISLSHTFVVAAITLVLGVFIGIGWNSYAPYLGISTSSSGNWSGLDEVYQKLSENYDGELDKSTLLDGAKHGMVAAIGDIYTEYLNHDESNELSDSLHGNIGAGIGIEFGLRDGYLRVLRTLPDNPARRAGVLAGDIIYAVNGEDVHSMTSEAVSAKLKGEAGTDVIMTVVRNGAYLDFTLTREVINNVSAYLEYRGDTAIITITRFDSDTGSIVEGFAKEIVANNATKLILDLRNNGGGYVSAARELLSLWVSGQPILIQRSIHVKDDQTTYSFTGKAILADLPTIVLVNGSTASASEIVVGALRDYDKATVLGETTYGKGVVQSLIQLSGGAELKVTSAHWYTPNGTSIDQDGLAPDIEVIRTYDDINAMRDPQLDRALNL